MIDNYTLRDVVGGVLGAALLSPVFVAPGYAVAWALDVRGFRGRGAAARAAVAVVLSVALAPTFAFLLARATSPPVAAAAFGGVALALVLAHVATRRGDAEGEGARAARDPMIRIGVAAALACAALVLVATSDLQLGARLYGSPLFFDYAKNVSVTDAIVRTGVPPANPSFYPGHGLPLFYYYHWFLLCALPVSVAGGWLDARGAVVGGTIWAGVALVAAVALYVCDVWPAPRRGRRRAVRVALSLLLVSGLDVLYVTAKQLRAVQLGHWFLPASVEWWNEQVAAWTNAVLWVPHHTAGLVAGLAALLLLREAAARTRPSERWALAAACAVALASLFGVSIWVAASFAASFGMWILVAWWRGWRGEARLAAAAGVAGGALALPFVRDLVHANLARGSAPVQVAVRSFYPVDEWADAHRVAPAVRAAARLATLPANYLAEFGFFAVAAGVFWWWRRQRPDPLSRDETMLLTVAASALVVSTFLRSALRFNDLGWRGMMLAQFVGLLWATRVWIDLLRPAPATAGRSPADMPVAPLAPWARVALFGSLAVGVATVAYDAVLLRVYPVLHDMGVGVWEGGEPPSRRSDGARLLAYRRAYEQAGRLLPADAVLQPNPIVFGEPVHLFNVDAHTGMYARRQIAVAHREYGTLYGVPYSLYHRFAAPLDTVFGNPKRRVGAMGSADAATGAVDGAVDGLTDGVGADEPPPPWPAVRAVCARLGITALVATADDPAWRSPGSWVWQQPAVVAGDLVRVIRC